MRSNVKEGLEADLRHCVRTRRLAAQLGRRSRPTRDIEALIQATFLHGRAKDYEAAELALREAVTIGHRFPHSEAAARNVA